MIVRGTSDLHLTAATAPYVMAALEQLRADTVEHGGITVLGGDLLDQAEAVHTASFNNLRDVLHGWPGPVFVLPGNHDQYARPRHALEALEGGPVTVIHHDIWTEVGLMLPYGHPAEFWPRVSVKMAHIPEGVPRIIWAHQGFKGAMMNTRKQDKEGIETEHLPEGWVIFTGHYHGPHEAGPDNRIYYFGSPYEVSFAEEGDVKSFIRFEDGMVRRINYGDIGAPRHITVHWDPTIGGPQAPEGVRPQDIIRVKTKATLVQARQSADQLAKAGLGGAPLLAASEGAVGRGIIDATMQPREAAERYVFSVLAGEEGRPQPDEMIEWAQKEGLWDAN